MSVHRTVAGIDIGADSIHVCAPTDAPPRKWPVAVLDLASPTWKADLLAIVQPGSLVALEPTGWHYSRPIVTVLEAQSCVIVYVNHASTAATRADHVSAQKTDAADARALAMKAQDIAMNGDLLGCKMHDPTREALTIHLRLLLTKHGRAMTQRRSALNHIGTFGHGVWPALDYHKETYAVAIAHGFVTPAQLRAWAAELAAMPKEQRPERYHHWKSRQALADLVAQIADAPEPDAGIVEALRDAQADLAQADATIAEVEARISELVVSHELLGGLTALWQTVPLASPMRCAVCLRLSWITRRVAAMASCKAFHSAPMS